MHALQLSRRAVSASNTQQPIRASSYLISNHHPFLYEKVYCARGDMRTGSRNARRPVRRPTSTATMRANQLRCARLFRLCSHLRGQASRLAHTQFAEATCGTIRSSFSSSPASSASARDASSSRSPRLVPTPTNAPGRSPPRLRRRRDADKIAAIHPAAHRRPETIRPIRVQKAHGGACSFKQNSRAHRRVMIDRRPL